MSSVGIKPLTFGVYTLYFNNSDRLEVNIYIYILVTEWFVCIWGNMGEL